MFLRKLTVLLVPLAMLLALCLLAQLFFSMNAFFGSLLLGALLGSAPILRCNGEKRDTPPVFVC